MRNLSLLLLLFLAPLAALAAETTEENPQTYPAYVKNGSPCKVEYAISTTNRSAPYPASQTYYLNRDGSVALMQEVNRLSKERTTYYYSAGKVAVAKVDNTKDGKTKLNKGVPERLLRVVVVYDDADVDRHGNWTKVEKGGRGNGYEYRVTIVRKIYYYDEDAAQTAQTEATIASARVDMAKYVAKLPALEPSTGAPYRPRPAGFVMNVVLPLALGLVFGLVPGLFLRKRRKVSNLVIILITAAIAGTVGLFTVRAIYESGPYHGLWAVLFWMEIGGMFLYALAAAVSGRCPKCGELDPIYTGHKLTTKTKTTTTIYDDGRKEVRRQHSYERETNFQCASCGYEWWELSSPYMLFMYYVDRLL